MPRKARAKAPIRKEEQACGFVAISHKPTNAKAERFQVGRKLLKGINALQERGYASSGLALGRSSLKSQGNDAQVRIINKRNLGKLNADFDSKVPGFEDAENFDDFTNMVDNVKGGIAHVRYVTEGSKILANAQPFPQGNENNPEYALAFNGNIMNYHELVEELGKNGWKPKTNVDTEVISELIKRGMKNADGREPALVAGVKYAMSKLKGGYSGGVYTKSGETLAFRDFSGYRPIVMGRLNGRHVFASETVALDDMSASFTREVRPGQIMYVNPQGSATAFKARKPKDFPEGMQHCMFESLYFSNHNSLVNVNGTYLPMWLLRARFGEALADRVKRNVSASDPILARKLEEAANGTLPKDVLVMSVPRSGIPHAAGLAMKLGVTLSRQPGRDASIFRDASKFAKDKKLPLEIRQFASNFRAHPISELPALWRKPDEDRSFIQEDGEWEKTIQKKFGFNSRGIKGKHIILMDDSIVRGNTLRWLVQQLRDRGAKSVHVVTAAPPIIATCNKGVAMKEGQYVAKRSMRVTLDETEHGVANAIGADTVTYSSISQMLRVAGMTPKGLPRACIQCMTGRDAFLVSKKDLLLTVPKMRLA